MMDQAAQSEGKFPAVFLIGAERSGTTLLRIMLDHHPMLAFRNEFEFAVDMVGDGGAMPDLDAYYEHLAVCRTFLMSGFEIDKQLDYRSLVHSFLEQKRARDDKPRVGATIHRHFHRILHLWPDARFIHLVRDGRDVAFSRIGMGWVGNAWEGAHEWVEVEEQVRELAAGVGPERIMRVTFESLVSEPEKTLGTICGFLGLEYDDAMLDYEGDRKSVV